MYNFYTKEFEFFNIFSEKISDEYCSYLTNNLVNRIEEVIKYRIKNYNYVIKYINILKDINNEGNPVNLLNIIDKNTMVEIITNIIYRYSTVYDPQIELILLKKLKICFYKLSTLNIERYKETLALLDDYEEININGEYNEKTKKLKELKKALIV